MRDPSTLPELLDLLPARGGRPAVGLRQELGLRWWSAARLYAEARRAARALAEAEIRPGEHVVLWAASSPEWVGWLFGAALRGVVVVPVDTDSSPALARQIADRVDARLVLHGAGQDASGTGRPCLPVESLASLPAVAPGEVALPVQPDDPALIYFTSGTTAKPRGVVLTHRNLTSQLARFRRWRPLVGLFGFRLLTIAPLSHIQGMMLGVCLPVYLGLAVFYTHAVHPAHLVRTLCDNRVTLLATVPRVLHLLGKALCLGPADGATLGERLAAAPSHFQRCRLLFRAVHRALGYRFWVVFVGGSALPREDEELWRDAGCLVVQGYGLTETAAMITVNAPVLGRRGSIGRPLAHQEVRIAEDGEVLVRGPNVSPGYYDDPESNRQAYVDGFLRTGDLVRRDADDHLFFAGRKKEMLVTGEGFNVYPDDVEAVLVRQPGVRDGAVIGVEREGHAEIHAVLLLAPGADPAAAVRQANAALEPHQRIRGWSVWPEPDFPRTSLLKVRHAEVAARLRHEGTPEALGAHATAGPEVSLADVLEAPTREERLQRIARYLAELPPERLAAERLRLDEDLGLSSLDAVELLCLLEARSESLQAAELPREVDLAALRARLSGAPPGSTPEAPRMQLHPRGGPRWAQSSLLEPFRRLVATPLLHSWYTLPASLEVHGRERLAGLPRPFILAGLHHEHGSDVFAAYCALPWRLRRKIAVVTGRWVFRAYLEPEPGTPASERRWITLCFRLLVPLFFPFVPVAPAGATREGLLEICRLIDRGYSPIVFAAPGLALVAAQCQIPIVPLHLSGNEGMTFRPRRPRRHVTARFGEPIHPLPGQSAEELWRRVQQSFPLDAAAPEGPLAADAGGALP